MLRVISAVLIVLQTFARQPTLCNSICRGDDQRAFRGDYRHVTFPSVRSCSMSDPLNGKVRKSRGERNGLRESGGVGWKASRTQVVEAVVVRLLLQGKGQSLEGGGALLLLQHQLSPARHFTVARGGERSSLSLNLHNLNQPNPT